MPIRYHTRIDAQGNVTQVPYEISEAEAEAEVRDSRLRGARATLATWAEQARAVEAQGGNVTQTQLKALFGRFATLCERLGDLIEERR